MRIIDADKFLKYLIFSKHIDGLTCGEVKEAIEMCKVDNLDKIKVNKIIEYLINELVGYMRGYVGSSNCPYKFHLLMADDIKKPDCPSRSCEDCKDEFFEKLTNKMIDNYVYKVRETADDKGAD